MGSGLFVETVVVSFVEALFEVEFGVVWSLEVHDTLELYVFTSDAYWTARK